MSINSLTDDHLRNSREFRAAGLAPASPDNAVSNALSVLVKYIPTESVTLYIAALSAAPALKTIWVRLDEFTIYWFFAAFTPVLLMVIYFGKRRAANLPALRSVREWPWWKAFAATVAFLVWALAVPNNPYVKTVVAAALIGFFAIFVSTILSVLEPLFDQPSNP